MSTFPLSFDQQQPSTLQLNILDELRAINHTLTEIYLMAKKVSEAPRDLTSGPMADGEDNYSRDGNKIAISQSQSRVSKGVGPKAPSTKRGK